jgi:uncharacterized protein (TIGR00369 family)
MSLADEIAPGQDGLSQMQMLKSSGRVPGILATMRFQLDEVAPGRVVFSGEPGEHVYNPIGTVHGGWAATLLDSACGCAVHTKLSPTQLYTTLELKVAYHKAVRTGVGALRAEATVVSFGRRAAFAEARLVGADGTLYATATSTLLVMDRV